MGSSTSAPGGRWRLRGSLAVPVLVVAVLLGTSTAAQAHTSLRSTDPADGSTVTGPLPTVGLTFSGRVFLREITVTDPAGAGATAGEATVEGGSVTQPVTLAAPGAYTVAYEVTSDDGHPLEGQLTFTYAPPVPPPTAAPTTPVPQATAEPSEAAAGSATGSATEGSDGLPGWALPTAAAVVLAAVAGFLVSRRRAGR